MCWQVSDQWKKPFSRWKNSNKPKKNNHSLNSYSANKSTGTEKTGVEVWMKLNFILTKWVKPGLSLASQHQERSLQAERGALWFLPSPLKEGWLYYRFILPLSFINSVFLSQTLINRDGAGELLMPFPAGKGLWCQSRLSGGHPKGPGLGRGWERHREGARPAHEGARSSLSPGTGLARTGCARGKLRQRRARLYCFTALLQMLI